MEGRPRGRFESEFRSRGGFANVRLSGRWVWVGAISAVDMWIKGSDGLCAHVHQIGTCAPNMSPMLIGSYNAWLVVEHHLSWSSTYFLQLGSGLPEMNHFFLVEWCNYLNIFPTQSQLWVFEVIHQTFWNKINLRRKWKRNFEAIQISWLAKPSVFIDAPGYNK